MWKRRREQAVTEKVAEDTGCLLVTMREAPDAELRTPDGQSIGLEVVSLVDQEFLASRRRLLETTEAIEQTLLDGGLQAYVTIGFDLQLFGSATDNASHKKWLKNLSLMSLIEAHPNGNLDERALREAGIERIAWLSWESSETPGVGWGYRTRIQGRGRTLADLGLAKKHAKLERYKEQLGNRFDAFWLAIDSFGAGTLEDGGFSMLLDRNFETAYDKVFLMIRGTNVSFSEARDVTPKREP